MAVLSTLSIGLWAEGLIALGLLCLTKLVWDIFFSPLKAIPGPTLAKVTDFWRAIHTYRGRVDLKHLELHRKYGNAVQIGPNCVSISDPNLIRTIYSTRNPWKKVSCI
jgi:hypothetical protein